MGYIKTGCKFGRKYGKTLKALSIELNISKSTLSKWDRSGFDIFFKAKELHCFKGNDTLKFAWHNIKERCGNPLNKKYKYYGGKGIKVQLSKSDLNFLWKRDKAYKMKKPSIDRKDASKDYTLDNCQFIEHLDNIKKRWKNKEA